MAGLCALAICAAAALPRAQVDGVVDAAMQELHLAGLSLAVVDHGRVALLRGYGLADVEQRVPVTADTVFESGAWAPLNYGFGWTIDTWRGRRVIGHSGGTPGFSSVIDRFPDDDLTVIVLTNHGDRVIDQIAIDIAGLLRPALARPRVREVDPEPELTATLKRALLDLFAGKHDAARFTPAMRLFLQTGTGKGLWEWLSADGELRSFDFAGEERAGDHRTRRYRAVLGTAHRSFSFTLASDGTIAQIDWW